MLACPAVPMSDRAGSNNGLTPKGFLARPSLSRLTVKYDPFIKSQLASRNHASRNKLGPCVVQCWPGSILQSRVNVTTSAERAVFQTFLSPAQPLFPWGEGDSARGTSS